MPVTERRVGRGRPGVPAMRDVSLMLRAGEILGIAGVSGNGQRELAEVIAGLRQPTQGQIAIDGIDTTGWSPSRLLKQGLSYIPEERMRDGAIRDFSVAENLILRDHASRPYAAGVGIVSVSVTLGRLCQLLGLTRVS